MADISLYSETTGRLSVSHVRELSRSFRSWKSMSQKGRVDLILYTFSLISYLLDLEKSAKGLNLVSTTDSNFEWRATRLVKNDAGVF